MLGELQGEINWDELSYLEHGANNQDCGFDLCASPIHSAVGLHDWCGSLPAQCILWFGDLEIHMLALQESFMGRDKGNSLQMLLKALYLRSYILSV